MEREEAFEFLGINKFRELGYTGSRVKIMSDEKIEETYANADNEKWEQVICPKGYQTNGSWHGSAVMHILQDICPDATFIAFPMDMKGTANKYESKCIDYILENKVHLFTTSSTGGQCSKTKEKAMQDCIDNGTTFFCAAGNENDDGMRGEAKSVKYIAIGALEPKKPFKKASYSSIGKELDYVSIGFYGFGTSFTTPTFCAMCGLVQDFFIDKTGRALVRSELIDFINDNLIDVEEEGFDIKTGHGLFVLPDPNTINIAKYVPEYSGSVDYSGFPEIKEEKKMPIVCLDAGHGIDTPGKRSPDGTLLEYEFNRDVANRIEDILALHGVEVLTYRGEDDLPLDKRCAMANSVKVDYFVSIHANAWKEDWNDANGWEIYVISKGGKAEQLAKKIHKYSQELGLKDRGIKIGNFQVLRDTDMPAVLIEHGFYTNKEECEKLRTDSFRQRCAEADAKGILEQLGIEYKGKDINVATKNEVADTNVGELVLKIGQKTYTVNGQKKELEVAPMIINGRTLTTVAPLRDLGLTVEWNGEEQTITIRKGE